MFKKSLLTLACVLAWNAPARAELEPEQLAVESLPETMAPHWVWVNEIAFDHMTDGRAYLVDGDSGRVLGMISAGYGHGSLLLHPSGKYFAVPATYFSRHTRGERNDVATFYKMTDLAPGTEVALPPKRYNGMPFLATNRMMPGGHFALVYNFTPEQSLTVLDMESRKVTGEFATPGCGLTFPFSATRFFLLCSDGSTQPGTLDAQGNISLQPATQQLFPTDDPVTEKGVWTGSNWLFFSRDGQVFVVGEAQGKPTVLRKWPLVQSVPGHWRPGGQQTAAYHQPTDTLFVLMHQGDANSHKDAGTELWVYKASEGKLLRRMDLNGGATSVAVSQDAAPLLYTANLGETPLKIRDVDTGKVRREVGGIGYSITVLQPAPVDTGHD
ncbi:methylamine dehydrogenase heavy chain [Novosphingobium sp. 1529]|uniref:amine dehydrogenase large subunit n=1 Tax=Novosphingobium sp. 1529 TaxID=3156424 RepID=UPI00339650CE